MRRLFMVCVSFAVCSSAFALSNRVFVQSRGTDTDACTLTAPCRSFSYAMTQVVPGGEIIALDTAGYGTFTINQSVSVFAAPGATAFIAVGSGGTGITITAGPIDHVVLRGLALSGAAASLGIDFEAGAQLSVENCIVDGFDGTGTASGIRIYRMGGSGVTMRIDRSTIRHCAYGIFAQAPSGGLVTVTFSNSTSSENNSNGFYASDNAKVVATDSVFANNGGIGVIAWANADNSLAQVSLERCTISGNLEGIQAGSGSAQTPRGWMRIAHNQIVANILGVYQGADGLIMTMMAGGAATNTIEGNFTNGTVGGAYNAK